MSNQSKTALFIARQWPDPKSTAAGWRMIQLIEHFERLNFSVYLATTQSTSEAFFEDNSQVKTLEIALNDDGFDVEIKAINPDYVVFDRFMTEEQYGWRVRGICPEALTILDTEDCHFLRLARAEYIKERPLEFDASACGEQALFTQYSMRELASIWRCDLSLIISKYEYELLKSTFSVPEGLLFYLPLILEPEKADQNTATICGNKSWSDRANFLWVGNRKHDPNDDSLKYLLTYLWPFIHRQLPEAALHIVGPNGTAMQKQLMDKSPSVVDLGWVDKLPELLSKYRVNLAPLRFGAGLKGKVLQSIGLGLPTVTSNIGAEGLFLEDKPLIGAAQSADEFIAKAEQLYTDKAHWTQIQKQGIECVNAHFSATTYFTELQKCLQAIKDDLSLHRQRYFMGQILQHQSLNASKYMGRWLTLKNQVISPE